jgi:hypothetical protein
MKLDIKNLFPSPPFKREKGELDNNFKEIYRDIDEIASRKEV